MSRTFLINGESIVYTTFGESVESIQEATPTSPGGQTYELGLAEGPIRVIFSPQYQEVYTDNIGPKVPVDLLTQNVAVFISMVLVHYDPFVLDACIQEGLGGQAAGILTTPAGLYNNLLTVQNAGIQIGGGFPVGTPFNHYIGLAITSNAFGKPYYFPATYLTGNPLVIPLGTEKSLADVQFRSIPYNFPAAKASPGIGLGEVVANLYVQSAPI